MASTTSPTASYFKDTRSLLYSYLISLPLLLLYEVMIFISQPNPDQTVRVSVDVWIKTLFSQFGNNVLSFTLIFVALVGLVILYRERNKLAQLKPGYFAWMLIESFVYAFVLALSLSLIVGALVQLVQPGTLQELSMLDQIALSLGAGIYEELFFRVILVSLLVYLFSSLLQKKWLALTLAIVLAALIFSLAHYVGALGDPFTFDSFLFRFLFGLALNALYWWRGFGVAAWTHAIYDIMVVVYG